MPPCKVASAADYDAVLVPPLSGINKEEDKQPDDDYDFILKGLFLFTTYLCLSMVFWILIAPASWLIGRSTFHRETLIPLLERMDVYIVVPSSIVTKYQDQHLIHFTHFIPSAIWAAIIPLQLHPQWRNDHRTLHRQLGYVFFACTFLVTAGVFIILHRKLTVAHFFPDLEETNTALWDLLMVGWALWFSFTSIQAVRFARAKKIVDHQKWMIRHVASGIWIAVQRMVLVPFFMVYYKWIAREKPTQWAQREIFSMTGLVAWWSSMALAEYAHRRISQLKEAERSIKKLN